MFQYISKRILIFIPTFFIISLFIFGLSKMTQGDPVLILLKGGLQAATTGQRSDLMDNERAYNLKAEELGLDKPTFYFGISSVAYPKDIWKINRSHHRELIRRLVDQFGNHTTVINYFSRLKQTQYVLADCDSLPHRISFFMRNTVNDLYYDADQEGIQYKIQQLKDSLTHQDNEVTLIRTIDTLSQSFQAVIDNPQTHKLYIPTIHWYGFNNQYHTWMFGDYPWFSRVDSSAHYTLDSISKQIIALRPIESNLNYTISKKKRELQSNQSNDISSNSSSESKPSQQLQFEIDSLEEIKADIAAEILILFEQKKVVAKRAMNYASKGILRWDFGRSYIDNKKVSEKIATALYWTMIINIISIFIAYLISIPLGIKSAIWKQKGKTILDNLNTTILFVLYSLPNFWIGTLLLVFFTTSEYASWMDLFPSSGAQDFTLANNPNVSTFTKVMDILHHLCLPIFCISYVSIAYLSRQMRGSMSAVIKQDYIRTARAKGLKERKVIWKHAFRNSLFPIVTLFSSVFPRSLSGSIAIEMIYTIPGMGYLLLLSIISRDWPVVFAIVMLVAIMTMIGNLIADILYAAIDPRVTY